MHKPLLWSLPVSIGLIAACGGDDFTGYGYDNGGCVESFDSCEGEQLCVNGACESAFPRRYELIVGAAAITERGPDGETWDLFGGAPDPYVEIYVDSELVARTSTYTDRFNVSFDEFGEANLVAGSEVVFELYDYDETSASDLVASCTMRATSANVRSRSFRCAPASGTTLQISVFPSL